MNDAFESSTFGEVVRSMIREQLCSIIRELAEGDWIWREFSGKDCVRIRDDRDRVYTYSGIELGVCMGLFIVEKEGWKVCSTIRKFWDSTIGWFESVEVSRQEKLIEKDLDMFGVCEYKGYSVFIEFDPMNTSSLEVDEGKFTIVTLLYMFEDDPSLVWIIFLLANLLPGG